MGEDEEETKVVWGTKNLVQGGAFSGVVVEAKIQKSDRSFDGKEPADQLFILIRPTNYEADEESWPRHWYSIKYSKKSKWAVLQTALEKCGQLPKESEQELVGKEFEWERRDLEFGVDRTSGEKFVSTGVPIPVKFLRDHNKTKGAKAPAPSPKEEETEKKTEETEVNAEVIVSNLIKKEPWELEKLYKTLSKDYGLTRPEAFKAIKALQKAKVIKLNDDETLTAIE